MPKLTVETAGEFEIPHNKRLVNALSDEAGIDQLHSCVAKLLPSVNGCKTDSYDLRSATERLPVVTSFSE